MWLVYFQLVCNNNLYKWIQTSQSGDQLHSDASSILTFCSWLSGSFGFEIRVGGSCPTLRDCRINIRKIKFSGCALTPTAVSVTTLNSTGSLTMNSTTTTEEEEKLNSTSTSLSSSKKRKRVICSPPKKNPIRFLDDSDDDFKWLRMDWSTLFLIFKSDRNTAKVFEIAVDNDQTYYKCVLCHSKNTADIWWPI